MFVEHLLGSALWEGTLPTLFPTEVSDHSRREMLISILQVKTWRSREIKKLTQGYKASPGEAKVARQVGLASRLCQQADLLQIGSKREAGGNSERGDCRRLLQPAFTHCRNPSYSGAQLACEPSGAASLAPSFLHRAPGLGLRAEQCPVHV